MLSLQQMTVSCRLGALASRRSRIYWALCSGGFCWLLPLFVFPITRQPTNAQLSVYFREKRDKVKPSCVRQCLNLVTLLAGRLAALSQLLDLLVDGLELLPQLAFLLFVLPRLVELDLSRRQIDTENIKSTK